MNNTRRCRSLQFSFSTFFPRCVHICLIVLFLNACNNSADKVSNPGDKIQPDTQSPRVIEVDPAADSTGVLVDKRVTVTFSEAINFDTVLPIGNISILTPNATRVNGGWNKLSDTQIQFTLAQPGLFAFNTQYTLQLTDQVTDLAANPSEPFSSTFTTESTPTVPNVIESTSPANLQADVNPNAIVTVDFSKSVLPTVLSATAIQVSDNQGNNVTGRIEVSDFDDTQLNFIADERYYFLHTYTVTVTAGLVFADQTTLNNSYVFRFTVRDGAWGNIQPIGVDDSVDAKNLKLFSPRNYNLVMVWDKVPLDGASPGSVHFRLFDNQSNIWGGSQLLSNAAMPGGYKIDFNDNGDGALLNFSNLGGLLVSGSIQLQRYQSGMWFDAVIVDQRTTGGDIQKILSHPNLTLGANGEIFVVWNTRITGGIVPSFSSNILSRNYKPDTSTNVMNLTQCGSFDDPVECSPSTATILSNGNIIATTSNNATRMYNTEGASDGADTNWGQEQTFTGESIVLSGPKFFLSPAIVSDDNNNAIILWRQSLDGHHLWANRHIAGSMDFWNNPLPLDIVDSGAVSVESPLIKMNAQGQASVVWIAVDANGNKEVVSNIYSPVNGWLGTVYISDAGVMASKPHLDIDDQNNVIVVWQQTRGDAEEIWSNRYTPQTGWQSAEKLSAEGIINAIEPQAAMRTRGDARIVWSQHNGTSYNLVGRSFE